MVKVYDELFDKIFLTELSLWLLQDCRFIASNIANGHTVPYGLEGTHRFLGSCIYRNNDGTAAKYWEYTHKEYIPVRTNEGAPWHSTERISDFFNLFLGFQRITEKKILLQSIDANLQFMGMDGTWHTDGDEKQTAFILMLAYHDIASETMGGEFHHKPSGEIIPFKQGRLIEISGPEEHKAVAFNVPYIPRFSIKFLGKNHEEPRLYL